MSGQSDWATLSHELALLREIMASLVGANPHATVADLREAFDSRDERAKAIIRTDEPFAWDLVGSALVTVEGHGSFCPLSRLLDMSITEFVLVGQKGSERS